VHPRVTEEWSDIVATYADATHKTNPERVEFTVELDPDGYNLTRTPIAVLIPAGYRATGPDGFLVPASLTLSDASLPASDASGVGMPGWLLVSFHMIDGNGQSTWRSTADPTRGDNFVGYASSIEAFLARRCS
jgi:hypothetical protein